MVVELVWDGDSEARIQSGGQTRTQTMECLPQRTYSGQKFEIVTSLHFWGCGSGIILAMIPLERLFKSQILYPSNKSTIWSLRPAKPELGPVKQKVRLLLA